ncbi:aminopeptidase P family protein [Firmicutes bacterium AF25-13AC]|nr:aminopeptidase P family protein [Firmicutes bacterium AF25-13AC]
MDSKRITALRAIMKREGIDYYYIPTADFHESEYVVEYFKARKFITGFTGSAGVAVIGQEEAWLWTDGRYFIQAASQIEGSGFGLMKMGQEGVPTVMQYLGEKLQEGQCIGFDARVVNTNDAKEFAKIAAKKHGSLKTDNDLLDEVWTDRPALVHQPADVLKDEFNGEATASKLARVREQMEKEEAQYHIISTLDDIAWILNVRGNDIPHVPVVLSFLVIGKEDAMWFVEENALSDAVKEMAAECGITIRPYEDVYAYAATIPENSTVLLDKRKVNYRITNALSETVHIVSKANPSQLMKAIKNEIELENTRKAHLLDGIAVTKFMYWLKKNVGKIPMDEVSVSDYLQSLREQMEGYRDISFDTIAGYNANAAMMHYKAEPDTAAKLEPQGMLLVDSGGHYDTGTTDITRTFVLGPISDIQKKHFTMVVKSNLNLANVKFLYGCNGISLDVICREPIWKENLDYQCGTGHGVGYLLNVHEGPNSFRWQYRPGFDNPFEAGMITTDEPGIYLQDQYGIRTENELICVKGEKNQYGQFMGFENITYVPIDLDGIDKQYLNAEDVKQLNDYHKMVYEKISPYMTPEENEWLKEYTREI